MRYEIMQGSITFLLVSKLRKVGFHQRWKVETYALLLIAQSVKLIDDASLSSRYIIYDNFIIIILLNN